MKKFVFAIFSLFLFADAGYAQKGMERIHAMKVAYITDKLHFTSSQSARFWPIYDAYEDEVRGIRKSFFDKYHQTDPDASDDAHSRQYIDDNLDYQEQIIAVKRKYNEQFAKVISPQQLAELYDSEREFRKMLIQMLRHHGDDDGGHWHRRP